MKPVAVNWTGPQRCYRAGGYSVFHKDETALLNDPKEVLFFQPWGTPKDGPWEAVHDPELGVIRPPCPSLTCGSSQSADLDGLWFECMVCGKMFRNLTFRMTMARTDPEAAAIEKRHRSFDENERAEKKFDELEIKLVLKARMADEAEARSKERAAAKKSRQAFHLLPPAPPPQPPPPRPRPPVYASLVKFCEERRAKLKLEAAAKRQEEERLLCESDEQASNAYQEWLTRNPVVRNQFSVGGERCPSSAKPSITIISDVQVACAACGHAFWGYFHLGVVPKGAVCLCCKGKRVVPWRGGPPESP